MPPAEAPRRHDWVYLHENWRRLLAAPLAAEDQAALARWTEQGRPLVVARRLGADAPETLRLGLALPGKRRIGIALPRQAVASRRRPPFLLDVIECATVFWPEAARERAAIIAGAAPDLRVFGSFAWQFFAADPGQVYVTPASDIDLLLTPKPGRSPTRLIALLEHFARLYPAPRLDGEIALPGGDFVSWREYAARPRQILVKGGDNVRLRPIGDIDLLLEARAA
jgi:phosphoribosyl-dephospho-CoA transferase